MLIFCSKNKGIGVTVDEVQDVNLHVLFHFEIRTYMRELKEWDGSKLVSC